MFAAVLSWEQITSRASLLVLAEDAAGGSCSLATEAPAQHLANRHCLHPMGGYWRCLSRVPAPLRRPRGLLCPPGPSQGSLPQVFSSVPSQPPHPVLPEQGFWGKTGSRVLSRHNELIQQRRRGEWRAVHWDLRGHQAHTLRASGGGRQ